MPAVQETDARPGKLMRGVHADSGCRLFTASLLNLRHDGLLIPHQPFALSLSKPILSLPKGARGLSCFDRLSTNGDEKRLLFWRNQ